MTGHNHYADCTCGWCVGSGGGGARSTVFGHAPSWPGSKADERSYTDPNARCPVCRQAVFFYRSPNGGRVFFDELGPPWPKHPCTDNPRVSIPRFDGAIRSVPTWKKAGWEAVRIAKVDRAGGWAVLKLNRCSGTGFIVRVCPWHNGIQAGSPAHIKPLNVFGFGRISYLCAVGATWVPKDDMLAHRTLRATTPQAMLAALAGDAESAFKTACATYRSWIEPSASKQKYRPFVDLGISREWMRKAAALGSTDAKKALSTEAELK